MRLFITLMIVVLVAGLAAPFYLNRPDGKPWMDSSELSVELEVNGSYDKAKLELYRWWHGLRRDFQGTRKSGKTRAYRWQDEQGNWYLSDEPAPSGKAEEVWVDPNVNLIASPEPQPQKESELENKGQEQAQSIPFPMTVDPSRVSKLIEDAKNVQNLVDKRYEQLDEGQEDKD